MVGSAKIASAFIDRIVAASGPKEQVEYQTLLKGKQQDVPGATAETSLNDVFAYYTGRGLPALGAHDGVSSADKLRAAKK